MPSTLAAQAPAADTAIDTNPGARFEPLLAEAERLHRCGQQRLALSTIAQLTGLVRAGDGLPLHVLVGLLRLRKRIVEVLRER